MTPRVFCVLRSGGEYTQEHVVALAAGVRKYCGTDLECLSDVENVPGRIPLQQTWKKWWAKLELFRPDITGDIFFIDLDTVLVGDCRELMQVNQLTMLNDFFDERDSKKPPACRIASGLMYLPESIRPLVWKKWLINPVATMTQFGSGGDQGFFRIIPEMVKAKRWQWEFPEQVVSYKVHINRHGLQPNNRIVCFHGKPRPWQVDTDWLKPAIVVDEPVQSIEPIVAKDTYADGRYQYLDARRTQRMAREARRRDRTSRR